MDDLLSEFIAETAESLDQINTELVHLEQHPGDREVLITIFRLVHTIKGTCGFFGLSRLEAVAHAAETALDRFREQPGPIPPEAFPVVLAAVDRIKSILADPESCEDGTPSDDRDLIHRLELVAAGDLSELAAFEAPRRPSRPDEDPELHTEIAPAAPPGQPEIHHAETVRVNLSVLDELMGMVGELVISRNQLLRMVRDQDGSPFTAPLKNLSQVVSGLQDGITQARVQPVQTAWAMLPRIVRDLAHELDKKIVLEMTGGEAELDRQIIEAIKDPLVHMIRNAADHGLEGPAERTAAGKRETGTISLKAWSEGGQVIVELADDGRGISLDAVTAKALATGILTEAEAGELSETQKANLIFHPGLSTSEEITAVSGRGVGMDVVRANIGKIGGYVDVQTTGDQGTVFHLRLPLMLSIVSALIVEVEGQQFALPQNSVTELVRAGAGTPYPIDQVNGARLLRLRELTIPLVSLNACLGLAEPAETDRRLAVVIRHGAAAIALSVDRVLDTEEIVVKPLTPLLAGLRKYSGTTILGDGRVVVILDPGGLVQGVNGAQRTTPVSRPASREKTEDDATVSLVVFRSGAGMIKAAPLAEIERLEQVNGELIKNSDGGWVMRHRDRLIPVLSLSGNLPAIERQFMILFRFGVHLVGLAVDEILDIEECRLDIELAGRSDLVRGIADLGCGPVEIIDLSAVASQVADRLPARANEAVA